MWLLIPQVSKFTELDTQDLCVPLKANHTATNRGSARLSNGLTVVRVEKDTMPNKEQHEDKPSCGFTTANLLPPHTAYWETFK